AASSGQRGFGLLRDLGKSGLVVDGKVREDLAVDVDRCLFETVHEHAVAHSELAHRRVDAGDPQRAEIALLYAPVAIGILPRLHHRFFGDTEYRIAPTAESLRLLQNLLVPRFGGN